MPISDKLIDQLLDGCDSPEDILGEAGLLKQLTKKVAERVLEAEMEAHCQWPLKLIHFWPIKLTHLRSGFANFLLQSIAFSSEHKYV
jgi:hypothetical protein